MLHFVYFFNKYKYYFKHAAHCPFFSSKCRLFHNATFFGSVLFTFYIQGVLKFKCKTPVPKGTNQSLYHKDYILLGLLGGLFWQRAAILASWRAAGGNSRPSWRSFSTSLRSSAMASNQHCFSSADRQQNSSHLSRTQLYTFNPCRTITPNCGSETIFLSFNFNHLLDIICSTKFSSVNHRA